MQQKYRQGKLKEDCEISYDRLYFIQINFNKINLNKNKLNLQKGDFYVYWQRKRTGIVKGILRYINCK